MGRSPLAVRRGPGDLYGMVPRRVFPPFLRAEKWGRPQAKSSRPVPVPAAAGNSPGLCGFAFCLFYSFSRPVASGGLLSRRGESRQRHAKGNLSRRRFPLESFPIGQGAAAPLRSPGVYGGRGTRDGVWTGKTDCHSRCAHRLRNDGDGGFARCGGTRVWTGPFPLGRVCVLSRGTGDPRAKSAAAINDPDSLFRARATCALQSVSG